MKNLLTRLRLRTQLLLAVNILLGAVGIGMLAWNYTTSVRSAIRRSENSLRDESVAVAYAVNTLRHHGSDTVQGYIDSVCHAMDSGTSPGHRIQVMTGDEIAYVAAHNRGTSNLSVSLLRGDATVAQTSVSISQFAEPVAATAREQAAWAMAGLFTAGVLTAVMVNALIVWLVSAPLELLVARVRQFGNSGQIPVLPPPTNRETAAITDALGLMMEQIDHRERDRAVNLTRARRLQSHLMGKAAKSDDIAIEYFPADEVAGDYVDVFELSHGDRLVCIADVVGHGVSAAMGAGILKALMISIDLEALSPAEILSILNLGVLQASLPEDFATMIIVRIPGGDNPVVYASAGHETCYAVLPTKKVIELVSTGMVLGIDPDTEYEDVHIDLPDHAVILLLSDGISEAMNAQGELLGRTRVREVAVDGSFADAREMAGALIQRARRHLGQGRPTDDMTVLALTRGLM